MILPATFGSRVHYHLNEGPVAAVEREGRIQAGTGGASGSLSVPRWEATRGWWGEKEVLSPTPHYVYLVGHWLFLTREIPPFYIVVFSWFTLEPARR